MGSNKRFFKMFARYDGTGRLIPGSNIWAKTAPKSGNWIEVQAYECCNGTTTSTTTMGCVTYQAYVSRGVALVTYVDCNEETQSIECYPGITTFCALFGQYTTLGSVGVSFVEEGCSLTTTTSTTLEGCVELGFLYNWFAVNDDRILANDGWHVPTRTEFITLGTYLGGVFVAGGKLKETGLTYWNAPNEGATNETGFNGRGAGYLNVSTGSYDGINQVLYMWTSTEFSPVNAFMGILTWISDELVTGGAYIKQQGSSVRLIKDDDTLAPYVGNDGKVYQTVKIGNQVWMAEDLAETLYANNDPIPHVLDDEEWVELETGALCPYDGDYTKVGCDEVASTTTTTTTQEVTTTTTTTEEETTTTTTTIPG